MSLDQLLFPRNQMSRLSKRLFYYVQHDLQQIQNYNRMGLTQPVAKRRMSCFCQQISSTNGLAWNEQSKRTQYLQFVSRVKNYSSESSHRENVHGDNEQWTHFGYEQVKEEQKQLKVYDVFESVAETYDLMNDVMSAGTHRLWKNHFVNQLKIKPKTKILDMAGGTGDIAFKMLDNLHYHHPTSGHSGTEIVVSDINRAMLNVGQKRAQKLGIQTAFQWVEANAEELPFEDDTFDLYTIAFGIRNTTHIDKVLDEAFRVLKVGGRFSCLEFSNVPNPLIRSLYDSYSFEVIPVLGQIFAQDWKSYQYLVESIRQFPNKEDFGNMIYDAGFSNVMFEDMTFGVVSIHDGFKI